jgi:hypothetical protein
MKAKFHTVKIRRSELSVIQTTVPQWELPILEAVHGRGNIEPVKVETTEVKLPEAEIEFERLTARYGNSRNKDGSIGEPHAENVFGMHQSGILNLQRAIEAAAA